jgi:hypothetical protein
MLSPYIKVGQPHHFTIWRPKMAESAFYIVPSDPLYLPSEEKRIAALAYFKEVSPLPNADGDYYFYIYNSVNFFDAGEGLEVAICPLCKTLLRLYEPDEYGNRGTYWEDWARAFKHATSQYENGELVNLEHVELSMPCCHQQISLLSLEFDMPSYFAKFAIGALEPSRSQYWEGDLDDYRVGSGSLTPEALTRFAEILGCPVKQLWVIC